jgi:hypothetical protein
MSQIIKPVTAGSLPPSVPTSFVTDSGTVIPASNFVNINGGSSTLNNANGIQVIANPNGSNNEVIQLTNRITGSATSIGLSTTTLITFPLSTTPGTYTFDCSIAGFATAGAGLPLGAGYTIVGSIRSNGTTATLLPSQAVDSFEDAALASNTSSLAVSGNNALIQVTGVTGFTIDWNATGNYVFVG